MYNGDILMTPGDRMTIREGKWKCSYCGGVNLGRDVKCAQCAQPRGKDVKFFLDGDAAEITDQGRLDQARSGADWTCAFCSTNNRGNETRCRQCGAERGTSPSLQEKTVLDAAPTRGGAGQSPRAPAPARRLSPLAIAGIAVGAVAAVVLVYFLFFSTTGKVGVVDRGEWQRTIVVEEYKWVTHTDWQDKVPAGAAVLRTWEEKYGTEKVQTGTERRKTGTKDMGNGYFEDVYENVPVYTERDVYKNKVEYRIREWVETRAPKARGDLGSQPAWPAVSLAAAEREKRREESAAVYFLVDDKQHAYSVPVDQLGTYSVGARYKLAVTPLGGVRKAEKE
jgi:hypothetical protein